MRSRGFTILEMLVAVLILSIIMFGVYRFFVYSNVSTTVSLRREVARSQLAQYVAQIQKDFSHRIQDPPTGSGPASFFVFQSTTGTFAFGSYTAQPAWPNAGSSSCGDVTIVQQVQSDYLAGNGQYWIIEYDTTCETQPALPPPPAPNSPILSPQISCAANTRPMVWRRVMSATFTPPLGPFTGYTYPPGPLPVPLPVPSVGYGMSTCFQMYQNGTTGLSLVLDAGIEFPTGDNAGTFDVVRQHANLGANDRPTDILSLLLTDPQ